MLAGAAGGSAGYRVQVIWDFIAGQKVTYSPTGEFEAIALGVVTGAVSGFIGYYIGKYLGTYLQSFGLKFGSIMEKVIPSTGRIGSIFTKGGLTYAKMTVSAFSGIPTNIVSQFLKRLFGISTSGINSKSNIIGGIDISNSERYSVSLNTLIGCSYSE